MGELELVSQNHRFQKTYCHLYPCSLMKLMMHYQLPLLSWVYMTRCLTLSPHPSLQLNQLGSIFNSSFVLKDMACHQS